MNNTTQMKALVYHAPQKVSVDMIEKPTIADNEVLIRVRYCGVCGTDIHIYNGDGGSYEVTPPLVLGHEFSGIVEAIGKDVTRVQVGDVVTIDPNDMCGHCYYCENAMAQFCENAIGYGTTRNGGFAEYCVASEKQVYSFEKDIDLVTASLAEPLSCCLHGIDLCDIQVGDDVLIIGGGPIGLIMLQLARMAGAGQIILSEPVAEKRALGEKLGATLTIDPINEDTKAILGKHCKNLRVVIECVGNVHTIQNAIDWAGKGSTVMMYGLTGPDAKLTVSPDDFFKKEIKLTSSFINPYTFERAVRLLQTDHLKLQDLVSKVVPLDDAVDVFENDDYRRMGKIIIEM